MLNTKGRCKIVHIAAHLGGGAGKAIAGILLNCSQQEYEHTLILLEQPQEQRYMEKCKDAGIPLLVWNQCDSERILSILISSDVVVINWWGHPLMNQFIVSMLSGIKTRWIYWFHVNGCHYPYISYSLTEQADRVFFTSSYSFDNLLWTEEERAAVKKKSSIIYGMGEFSPEKIKPKEEYALAEICFGYVGTVSYSKMHREYLHYVQKIKERLPGVSFLFVGECAPEILEEIKEMGLERTISCVGKVEDVYLYYKKMTLLLYLLNPENYGTTENVLLEAMAVGLPIIVLNHPVEQSIIKTGKNGYVAENEGKLMDIVCKLCKDENLCEKIGRSARTYVIENYSAKKNLEAYQTAIGQTMEKGKRNLRFHEILGDKPYEWFLSATGFEKGMFEELLLLETSVSLEKQAIYLPEIYYHRKKGSPWHYLEYYNDAGLRKLCEVLQTNREKIEEKRRNL